MDVFEDTEETDLDLQEMEGHIWRLIMEKTLLLSVIAVVLLAVVTITKVALVKSTHVAAENTAQLSLKEDRLFVRCEGGRLAPQAGSDPLPERFDGRRVALLLSKEETMCVEESFQRGAAGLVFGQVASPRPPGP